MDEPGFELVMPFVAVSSMGGPFDDAAYAAGWEMGSLDERLKMLVLDERLKMLVLLGGDCPFLSILRANLAQLELIAMRHGLFLVVLGDDHVSEWVSVRAQHSDETIEGV